jgi:cell division protein FtsB
MTFNIVFDIGPRVQHLIEGKLVALYDQLKSSLEGIQAAITTEGEQYTAAVAALNATITALEAKIADLSITPEQSAELVSLAADIRSGVASIVPDAPAPSA